MAGKSLNKVQLIGHLGADPEMRYTAAGKAVCAFNLATNERHKEGEEWVETTEWHKIVAWEKTAEIAGEHLAKGRQVYVEGRLQTRSWKDKQGNKRYTTEIVARDIILLGGRGDQQVTTREEEPPQHEEETPF